MCVDTVERSGLNRAAVMTGSGGFIEVQGTAEGEPFSAAQMQALIALAQQGITRLIAKQKAALGVA